MSKKHNYKNYNKYSNNQNVEQEVRIEDEKIPPEDISEKVEEEAPVKAPPKTAELIMNVYARETPYGHKVFKAELDRILGSKVIPDPEGFAIVPKGTRIEVYDMFVHEDGTVWYACRFGYLMAKSKDGVEYIKELA